VEAEAVVAVMPTQDEVTVVVRRKAKERARATPIPRLLNWR
jgi:hypothetical protein